MRSKTERQHLEQKQAIIEIISAGGKALNVMARFGVSMRTVIGWVKDYRIAVPVGFYASGKPPKKPEPVSEEEHCRRKTTIARVICENGKIADLECALGISRSTCRNWLKLYGIETPKGFYSNGLKAGRPKGFNHTQEWKDRHRATMTGAANPFYGRTHSNETKSLMSKNHARLSGDANPFKRSLDDEPAKREAHRERCQELWDSRDTEWRAAFGSTLSKAIAGRMDAPTGGRNHKTGVHHSMKAGSFWFRSSWEEHLATILDEQPLVQSYTFEGLAIPYDDYTSETSRHFKPDFIIDFGSGHRLMIEVKPRALVPLQVPKLLGQWEYAFTNGIQYIIVGADELFSDEIHAILLKAYNGDLYAIPPNRCGIVGT